MKLGIPYMGSKRKLSKEILKVITNRHSGITDFYDLFGGGGSISFTAVKYLKFNIHYNELNKHIYSLVKYLIENKELEPKFYDWVTREVFFEQINKTDEEADWYSGFVMSCWSFGNKQSSYLYGEDIDSIKKLAHDFITLGCKDSMITLGIEKIDLINISDIQKRRLLFCNYIKKQNKERFDVQNLERMVQLERIQNLQNLQVTNLSYEQVNIKGKNPVIYCDIPYKGTGEYKEGGFNHDEFYDWANNCIYPVYISEYDAPFIEVESFKHRSTMSATNNKKVVSEKIFWNGKGEISNNKLF